MKFDEPPFAVDKRKTLAAKVGRVVSKERISDEVRDAEDEDEPSAYVPQLDPKNDPKQVHNPLLNLHIPRFEQYAYSGYDTPNTSVMIHVTPVPVAADASQLKAVKSGFPLFVTRLFS